MPAGATAAYDGAARGDERLPAGPERETVPAMGPRRLTALLAVAAGLCAGAAAAQPRTIEGPGRVAADGSIHIYGDRIQLYGIWLPRIQRTCSSLLDPTFCASAPVVVLFEKVDGFLVCQIVRELGDSNFEGYCGVRGNRLFDPRQDLGAMMVEEGWALARPDAPPEYVALERLAQSRELGIWGNKFFQVR